MTALRCLSATCHRPDRPGRQLYLKKWCSACYRRWCSAGRPEDGPPPPQKMGDKGRETRTAERQARIAETVRLTGLGLSRKAISEQVGVRVDAIRGYLREYRKSGGVIDMSGIEGHELRDIGPERVPGKAAEPKVDRWRNGRDLSDEEMDVVAQAHKAAADREAAILSGVVWKQQVA